jgi:hypothetical protein
MQFKHLLAKSTKNPDKPRPEETLVGHTEAVVQSARGASADSYRFIQLISDVDTTFSLRIGLCLFPYTDLSFDHKSRCTWRI